MLAALQRSGLVSRLIERVIHQSGVERVGVRLAQHGDVPELVHLTTLSVLMMDWRESGCRRPVKELAALAAQPLTQPLYHRPA